MRFPLFSCDGEKGGGGAVGVSRSPSVGKTGSWDEGKGLGKGSSSNPMCADLLIAG
jgi:hypothetical protein